MSYLQCHCRSRTPSSYCSSSSSSSSGSSHRRPSRISSASSLKSFPVDKEPSDYPQGTLSKATASHRHPVLLDKMLWKADSEAVKCDTLDCQTHFSLLERRHHCRKCGGVFCDQCSSYTLQLLDTSKMNYVIPSSHLPLLLLALCSPSGSLVPSKVCKGCHEEVTVDKSLRTRTRTESSSGASLAGPSESKSCPSPSSLESPTLPPLSHSPGSADSASTGWRYPPGTTFVLKPRHLRRDTSKLTRTNSSSSMNIQPSSPLSRTCTPTRRGSETAFPPSTSMAFTPFRAYSPTPTTPNYSAEELGVLAEYPLKMPSKGCKSTGGAFWHPKPLIRRVDSPVRYDHAVNIRRSSSQVTVGVVTEEDIEEEDEGAPPVVPDRRVIRTRKEVDPSKVPFASLELLREKDCVSTF